jgi:hypothetical protein
MIAELLGGVGIDHLLRHTGSVRALTADRSPVVEANKPSGGGLMGLRRDGGTPAPSL